MARSRRAKVIHLSKVQKKTKESKEQLVDKVQSAVDEYPYIYVVEVDNMRNLTFQEVRKSMAADSKFILGRNAVMASALGKTPELAAAPGLDKLSTHLKGQSGLLFSHREPSTMLPYLESLTCSAFARSGNAVDRDFIIPAGVIYSRGGEIPVTEDVKLTVAQETTLRAFGMPTRTARAEVILDQPYTVCRVGDVISWNQAAILKFFGVHSAEFKIGVKAVVKNSAAGSKENASEDDDDDEDDE